MSLEDNCITHKLYSHVLVSTVSFHYNLAMFRFDFIYKSGAGLTALCSYARLFSDFTLFITLGSLGLVWHSTLQRGCYARLLQGHRGVDVVCGFTDYHDVLYKGT